MPSFFRAYRCDYCDRIFKTYNNCDTHERACLKNPNTKNCLLCIHYNPMNELTKNNKCDITGKRFCKRTSAFCGHFENKHKMLK